MCCGAEQTQIVRRWKKKLKAKGILRAYKIVSECDGRLCTSHRSYPIAIGEVVPEFPCNGDYTILEPRGIHVWIKRPTALITSDEAVLPVTVQQTDFIFAGAWCPWDKNAQAVFRKVRVGKLGYLRAERKLGLAQLSPETNKIRAAVPRRAGRTV
jgi:hypothetical protein